jgi:hypothetical protein
MQWYNWSIQWEWVHFTVHHTSLGVSTCRCWDVIDEILRLSAFNMHGSVQLSWNTYPHHDFVHHHLHRHCFNVYRNRRSQHQRRNVSMSIQKVGVNVDPNVITNAVTSAQSAIKRAWWTFSSMNKGSKTHSSIEGCEMKRRKVRTERRKK